MSYNGPVNIQVDGAREDPRAQVLVAQGRRMLGALDALARANPKQAAVARQWGNDQVGYVKAVWTPNIKTMYVVVPVRAPSPPSGRTVTKKRKLPDRKVVVTCVNGLFFKSEQGDFVLPANKETGLVELPNGGNVIESVEDLIVTDPQSQEVSNPKAKESPKSSELLVFAEPTPQGETQQYSLATGHNRVLCLEEMGNKFYPLPNKLNAPRAMYFSLYDGTVPTKLDKEKFVPFRDAVAGAFRLHTTDVPLVWSRFSHFPEDYRGQATMSALSRNLEGLGANTVFGRGRTKSNTLKETDGVPVEDSREQWYGNGFAPGVRFNAAQELSLMYWQRLNLGGYLTNTYDYRNLHFVTYGEYEMVPSTYIKFAGNDVNVPPTVEIKPALLWHGIDDFSTFPGTVRPTTEVKVSADSEGPTSSGSATVSTGVDPFDMATVTAWELATNTWIRTELIVGLWDYYVYLSDFREDFFTRSAMINHKLAGVNPGQELDYDVMHGFPYLTVYSGVPYTSPVEGGTTVNNHLTSYQNLFSWSISPGEWAIEGSIPLPGGGEVTIAGSTSTSFEDSTEFTFEVTGDLSYSGSKDLDGDWYMSLNNDAVIERSLTGEYNMGYGATATLTFPDYLLGRSFSVPLEVSQSGQFPVAEVDNIVIPAGTSGGTVTAIPGPMPTDIENASISGPMVTLGGVELGPAGGNIFSDDRPLDNYMPWIYGGYGVCYAAAGFYWTVEDKGYAYLVTIMGDNFEVVDTGELDDEGAPLEVPCCRKAVTALVMKSNVPLKERVIPVKRPSDWDRGVHNVTQTDIYDVVANPATGQYFKIKDAGVDTARVAFLHVSSLRKYSKLLLDEEGRTITWEEPDGA